jgi:hypothetical protein
MDRDRTYDHRQVPAQPHTSASPVALTAAAAYSIANYIQRKFNARERGGRGRTALVTCFLAPRLSRKRTASAMLAAHARCNGVSRRCGVR